MTYMLILNCALKLVEEINLDKIQLMTSINRLHVSALGCHPKGLFQVKGIQVQQVNLSMRSPAQDNMPEAACYLYDNEFWNL